MPWEAAAYGAIAGLLIAFSTWCLMRAMLYGSFLLVVSIRRMGAAPPLPLYYLEEGLYGFSSRLRYLFIIWLALIVVWLGLFHVRDGLGGVLQKAEARMTNVAERFVAAFAEPTDVAAPPAAAAVEKQAADETKPAKKKKRKKSEPKADQPALTGSIDP